MTELEKKEALELCENKMKELTLEQQKNDSEWDQYYNEHFGRMTKCSQIVKKVGHSKITALIIAGGAIALFSTGQPVSISLGVPCGCVTAIGIAQALSKSRLSLAIGLDTDYWKKLGEHEDKNENIETQITSYNFIFQYLKYGDSYLLHYVRDAIMRQNEFDLEYLEYFDISRDGLSPLLITVLAEMKEKVKTLRQSLREDLRKDIAQMSNQIAESDDISTRDLESIKKMLLQYVPRTVKEK